MLAFALVELGYTFNRQVIGFRCTRGPDNFSRIAIYQVRYLPSSSGLGKSVVLTAWRKILKLDSFEPAAAAAFVDTYRGRGPEKRVR